MNFPHLPRPLKIGIALYVAYLALVLLILTPLLNFLAPKIYRAQTGAELHLDKIVWLNPFTLSITARNISSINTDNSPFWSFDEFKADISLASLWRGHLVLDALALNGLAVQITQTAPARYNFSDILDFRAKQFPPDPAPTQHNEPDEPFAIDITQLDITAKQLGYRAPHIAEPVNITMGDLHFAATNFSTAAEKNTDTEKPIPADKPATAQPGTLPAVRGTQFELATKSFNVDFIREHFPFTTVVRDIQISLPAFSTTENSDYQISWRDDNIGTVRINGNASLAQSNTAGRMQLSNLNVLPAWQYPAEKLTSTLQRAQLDGDIQFHLDWSKDFAYRIRDSQLALHDVQLQSREDADTGATFAALRATGIAVDSTQPHVHIANIALEQPVLRGWNRDTKVSLLDMITFPGSDEADAPSPWRVVIDTIQVADGTVHWRANQLDNRQFTIMPLTLRATNLHWPDPAPLQFNLAAAITGDIATKQNIDVALDGELIPGDVTGNINAAIAHLPLALGNTFLQRQMHATIADGALHAKFAITLDKAQATRILSDGFIDKFELIALPGKVQTDSHIKSDNRKLASWKKMAWQQLTLTPLQQRLSIKQIVLTQPWTQFRLNADRTNNFQQLMVSETQSDVAPAQAETPMASRNLDSRRRASDEAISTPPHTKEKPWQFAITTIHIDRANIDFRDTTLTSAFRTNITDLSGDISNLDSSTSPTSKNRAAKVALKGTIDGYAPVALTGDINPFAAKPELNITLDITNVDLAALTPYSGTYAGYQIDSGRLTVQLAYTLENDRLKGKNRIVVNQMQLGKQVSGPKVMDLPLRLAIYLLTDANGLMELDVDVTGNVDDPDFSVGSIIWKALGNLIVKTATSPFRALGRLVGSDRDDLDRIEFQAGSDQLASGERDKLQPVNQALQKKSALKLNIAGHVSPSRDLEALRDNTLSAQLIAESDIAPADIQQQSENWQRAVTKLFKQRFPHEKNAQWQVMQMNDAMRDNIELSSNALPELAAQRALALKQVLATDFGLAADRAFVKPVDLGTDTNPGAFATLSVE